MKNTTASITASNILFIILLSISGALSGAASEIVYALAFLIPSALLIYISKEEKNGLRILPSRAGALLTAVAAPLSVGAVFLISFVTAYLFSKLGFSDSTELSGKLWQVILTSALLPALFEETLFRYATLRALGDMPNTKKVLISAFFFAFSHCSLFSIPYAFLAGVIFASLAIITNSILPSFIIHFINNVVSILWITYFAENSTLPFILILAALALVSAVALILARRYFFGGMKELFKRVKPELPSPELAIYAAITLLIAVGALIS